MRNADVSGAVAMWVGQQIVNRLLEQHEHREKVLFGFTIRSVWI